MCVWQALCILNLYLIVVVQQLAASFCGIGNTDTENTVHTRRDIDYTIAGARHMCNHTCPTHCTDLYDPVCAEVNYIEPNTNKTTSHESVLINHCHADLLSCATQQTVKILTIDECAGMMAQFAYSALAQAATMKGLGLMDA